MKCECSKSRILNTWHTHAYQVHGSITGTNVQVYAAVVEPSLVARAMAALALVEMPIGPFRTAVPFWGLNTWNWSSLCSTQDCSTKKGIPDIIRQYLYDNLKIVTGPRLGTETGKLSQVTYVSYTWYLLPGTWYVLYQ